MTAAPPSQFLTFSLAGEGYALGLIHIREILELPALTPVPRTPPWLRGVMNLRGSVVPVVDLAVKLGLTPAAGGTGAPRPCVVIVDVDLDGELAPLGLAVDAVDEVVEFEPGSLAPLPSFGTPRSAELLAGVASLGGTLVLVLDAGRLLAPAELAAAADLAAGVPPPAGRLDAAEGAAVDRSGGLDASR